MPGQTNSTVFLRPRGLASRQEGCTCLRPSVREKLHPVKRAVDIDARRADARVTAVQNVRAVARRIHPRIHDLGCAFLAGGDVLPRPEIGHTALAERRTE